MKALLRRFHSDDQAQVLAIFAMLTFVIIGLMGLASDIGRIYVARAELGRSVDAAALAGAKQLPDIDAADVKARAYIAENEPSAVVSVEVYPDVPSQQVEVRATKTVDTVFLKVLGVGTVQVKNSATAGFGIVPVDAVMALDATGSMDDGCNQSQTNSGCPIYEAKQAAITFTNTLLPGNNTVVGNTSFRGCFNPPRSNSVCIPTSTIGALTSDAAALTTKINQMTALGGSGTNICGGIDKAAEVLYGTNSHTASNTIRNIIILSDGDNTYNASASNQSSPVSPDPDCRPTSPSTNDPFLGVGCSQPGGGSWSGSNPGSTSMDQERKLDILTMNRATALKTAGVQIYFVAFGMCGTDDGQVPTPSYCQTGSTNGLIGSNSPDTVIDQKLGKCVASSTPGTNDHFFRANTAQELPGIFSQIAQQIAFRLIK
jgi:Flp pilus assembly protein TadG